MDDNITVNVLGDQGSEDCTIDISSYDVTIDAATIDSIFGPSYIGTGLTTSQLNGTSYTYGSTWGASTGNITINNSCSTGASWITGSNYVPFSVTGDAEFDGDVKIKGVSIAKTLEDIQKRLAILVPDPEKLAHFEALKKAYDHYKTLEALCEVPKKDD